MKWLKVGAVVFCAVTITALGIDASDTLTGRSGTLLGQLVGSTSSVCPDGMVEVGAATAFTCIDRYEASAGEDCPLAEPASPKDTIKNVETTACQAGSKKNVEPWRFITRDQAAIVCARAGKRLPSAGEWYVAALGTVDDSASCNIDSNSHVEAGTNDQCISAHGAEDMVGNVWEWVSDDVIDGVYSGRNLPDEGYVGQVDGSGMPTLTTKQPSELFGEDYVWSKSEGAYAILRGGFYGSRSDAGLYAVHAETLPTAIGTAIGFRCVK